MATLEQKALMKKYFVPFLIQAPPATAGLIIDSLSDAQADQLFSLMKNNLRSSLDSAKQRDEKEKTERENLITEHDAALAELDR